MNISQESFLKHNINIMTPNELMFLKEHVHACKQVSKMLKILYRFLTNKFVIGDETKDSEVVMMDAVFEHL